MNTKITALVLTAATALSFAPKTASAHDRGCELIGGFLSGLIVGSVINENHREVCAPPAPNVGYERCSPPPCEPGCWESVNTRVWVPACWVAQRDYSGCDSRRYVVGHYECRVNRVWVSQGRYARHPREEVGYGYGRRR